MRDDMHQLLVRNGALALGYFVVAWISLQFAYRDLQITAIWLPSGMALAAVLVYGARMSAGILVGDFVTGLVFGTPFAVAIGVAVAGVLEALVGAQILPRREAVRSGPLFGVSTVLRFVLRGALLAPVASTVVGAGAMYLGGLIPAADLPRALAVWWTGDVVGILLVLPPVLLVLATGRAPKLRSAWDPLLLASTVLVTAVVFFLPGLARTSGSALAYLIFPMLLWCAFAFTASLLALTNLLVAIFAVAGTALGRGPFAVSESMSDIWYLQAFVAAFAITSLMLRGAIEDRRRAGARATELENHFLAAAENGAHLVLIVQRPQAADGPLRIVYANRRAQAMLAEPERIEEAPELASALPLFATAQWHEHLQRALREQKSSEKEVQLAGAAGASRWLRCTVVPLEHGLMLTMLDITDQRVAQERIERLAVMDSLTGLPNRAALDERLVAEVERARRDDGGLGVLFIDINDFKNVNDTVGHHAGDQMLVQIARRLEGGVRRGDLVSRPGGDEFIIVAPQARNEEVSGLALRLLATFEQPFFLHGREFHVTCSVGVAILGVHGDDAPTLLRNADTAMYHAKRTGRGNLRLFDSDMAARTARRRLIESALRGAIERGEFVLHYQPVLSFAGGRLVGAEALLRWQQPELGNVTPAEFIGIAEESGQIETIGAWVLEHAARQVGAWQGQLPDGFRIAVNLSARQMNRGLLEKVQQALQSASPGRPWLELEITESLLMRDLEQCRRLLLELRKLGVTTAVDDFGTGYSSLSYLKSLPIDAVKIDRSFVRNIREGTSDARLVAAVVALCKVMNLRVVAEGVESVSELEVLEGLGCDDYQGFVASPAVAADEFRARFLAPEGMRAAGRS